MSETVNTYTIQPPGVSVFSASDGKNNSSTQSKDHFKKPNLQPINQAQKK